VSTKKASKKKNGFGMKISVGDYDKNEGKKSSLGDIGTRKEMGSYEKVKRRGKKDGLGKK